MKAKTPWHSGKVICVAVFFIAALITLVAIAFVQNKPIPQKYKYGIVLDAGSSHTAVYIYEWPAEKENNTGMVRQRHTCAVKGKGISSYAQKSSGAGQSLMECIEDAKGNIPADKHEETPVYLGATAGMRLLRMQDSESAEEVMTSVKATLMSSPFDYQGARIISGQEEGAFGWITVNYLGKNFRKAAGTMGALDLGGASTQITFVSGQSVESPDNSMDFRLYGNDYQLYTHSFLCYGKDQVLKLALEKRLMPVETSLEDPCFHPGYSEKKSVKNVFDTPCVHTINKEDMDKSFTHNGTGNFTECQSSIMKVFNFSQCTNSRCSFNGVYQPPIEGTFGAFSAFYFVMNFLNLTGHSLADSKRGLEVYCNTPWDAIKERHPTVKHKYLAEYCFSGTYILTLLENGYNFTFENWKHISFIDKIEDSNAGWTLGYMLNLTNMIPAEAPDTPLMPHGGFVTLVLFLTIFLLILLLLWYKFLGLPSCSSPKEVV
ncbi:ectonucleoside triphosphate diphosphohydrolase 1 isoform X2 [Clupea harengus]|nr:ectonucleoside triphosphate diphosphohydrolase 1 isoform X2 [Clupea harengus]XP_031438489.1 ectonucleoside triphosphate diphosphohydrolase 1 isoform X2 [Clupea harengus]